MKKKKNAQGIYTKNKSCIWPLSSLYKKNICIYLYMCVCVWLRHVPLPTSTPRHCCPLRNHTEYSTSRFVLLHLNCKTRGRGTKIRIYQVYTEYDSLWVHTEIRENSWTAFFFSFFLLWRPWQRNNNFPPCLIFTSPLSLPNEGLWRRIKGAISLSRFSSPPLVCLWWRQLWRE